ncbi:MAG: hypothetical protein ACLQGT_15830 [Terracidiphilus sp.]
MKRQQRSEIGEQGEGTSSPAEETLRLIARLSAPEGLEERVQTGLRAASHTTLGRVRILQWPVALRLDNAWMQSSLARMAAAAAIVAVVVGGGWGVISRVQPAQPARAIAIPPRASAQGSFSSAGAMRTPQTLNGPVVAQTATATQTGKPAGKTPARHGKPSATKKGVLDHPAHR